MLCKRLRVFISIFIVFVICCMSVLCFADGKNSFELWVSPTGSKDIDAILWYEAQDARYFFIPGNVNLSDLKIGFTKYDFITVNDKEVKNGDSADVFLSENELIINKRKFHLVVMTGSKKLPSVFITTNSGNMYKIHNDKNYKESGNIVIYNGDGMLEHEGALKHMKMRGNASVDYAKKNYQFKLSDGANLLGMGKAKKWILLCNHLDKSLIRNEFSFDMAMYAGLQYTPEHQQCELYINNIYYGLYMLTEKIEPDDDRVDIKDLEKETEKLNDKDLSSYKLAGSYSATEGKYKGYNIPVNPDDITGGYIMEFEGILRYRYHEEPSAYETNRGISVVVKYPEYASKEQMEYISPIIQSMENAIFAKDGVDQGTGKHFTEIIDLDSFVCKYLLDEIAKNYDSNASSEFFYKPEDSKSTKLFAGPIWDFDNSYGDYAREDNAKKVLKTTGIFVGNAKGADFWWPALYKQPPFYRRMVEMYETVFAPAIDILLGNKVDESGVLKSLDEYEDRIKDSAAMNYVRYPKLKQIYGNVQTGKDLHENIEYLKNYLIERKAFLDSEWLLTDNP